MTTYRIDLDGTGFVYVDADELRHAGDMLQFLREGVVHGQFAQAQVTEVRIVPASENPFQDEGVG